MEFKWLAVAIFVLGYVLFLVVVLLINRRANKKPIGPLSKLILGPIALVFKKRYENNEPVLTERELVGWSVVFLLMIVAALTGL